MSEAHTFFLFVGALVCTTAVMVAIASLPVWLAMLIQASVDRVRNKP
jgi:hypothetical protein